MLRVCRVKHLIFRAGDNGGVNKMGAQILALLEQSENSLQVVKSLALAGYDVIACQTFTQAIAVLKKQPQLEMIISDVHLENGGSVFDFLRWLKSDGAYAGTSLVLFSFRPTALAKHLEDGIRTAARILGVAKYLTMESFDSELFCKNIQSVLAEHHGVVDQQIDENIKVPF